MFVGHSTPLFSFVINIIIIECVPVRVCLTTTTKTTPSNQQTVGKWTYRHILDISEKPIKLPKSIISLRACVCTTTFTIKCDRRHWNSTTIAQQQQQQQVIKIKYTAIDRLIWLRACVCVCPCICNDINCTLASNCNKQRQRNKSITRQQLYIESRVNE